MTMNEQDSQPKSGSGKAEDSEDTSGEVDVTREGTKEDIRSGGGEKPPPKADPADRLRDGTK
jgi:hypothetical protein